MKNSERVLVLAPDGRDGRLAVTMLEQAGKQAESCTSATQLVAELEAGAGVAVIVIEALQHGVPASLIEWIAAQPAWSDFPFVVLSRQAPTSEHLPLTVQVQATLGNVIFLDRPFHAVTFINAIENALRGRRRQYQARAYLQELEDGEARLRFLDTLGKATAESGDADQILALTTQLLGQHLGVAICAYADMEADEDHFTIRGDWSRDGSGSIVGYYSLADFGRLAVTNLRAGLPLVVNDNLAELPPEAAATFQKIGISSTICMPLVKEGRLTALMAVHDRVRRVWTGNELALVLEVTQRSWPHIERVRSEAAVLEAERRFRRELEAKVEERTAALEQSEKNIRTIFETSHLYQGLTAQDGTLLYANATSLAGIEAEWDDVVGRPYWDTPWFTSTPGMSRIIRDAIARVSTGEAVDIDATLKLPTGERRFDFSIRPVINDAGEVVAMVPEAIETTARVKAEEALQQAQKMEAIGNLTGGVAHDFNNLLAAVVGSLDLLRKRLPDDPALLRLVDNATAGATRGTSLTRRLLAFARRQELKTERVSLQHLVGEIMDLMQRSLGPMIAVETAFPEGLPPVESDANQLKSALLNLAVNARDAMQGQGSIHISAREEMIGPGDMQLAAGSYVVLAVRDSGEGMDEATLKRATEPFFTTKGVGKGTGLGLSMVHGLAQQSGGMLLLKSAPGKGTTAEIWLPANLGAGEQPAPPSPPVGVEHPAEFDNESRRLKVLVVDDDALVLMNTVDMLEDLGHQVVSANSGAEALGLADSTRFDVVVTDHAMPRMTGAQLATALRSRQPALPIILATGYAELPPGSDIGLPRLSKPFSQADLEVMMTRIMRRELA